MAPFDISFVFEAMEKESSKRSISSPTRSTSSDIFISDTGSSGGPELNRPKEELPVDYQPSDVDVICGRGKGSLKHDGNARYLQLIRDNMDKYRSAQKKVDRSVIVTNIISSLRNEGARFVRCEDRTGRWWEIGDEEAKKKTGHAIRDLLLAKGNPIRGKQKKPRHESTTVLAAAADDDSDSSRKRTLLTQKVDIQKKRQKVERLIAEAGDAQKKGRLGAVKSDTSLPTDGSSVGHVEHNPPQLFNSKLPAFGNKSDPTQQLFGMDRTLGTFEPSSAKSFPDRIGPSMTNTALPMVGPPGPDQSAAANVQLLNNMSRQTQMSTMNPQFPAMMAQSVGVPGMTWQPQYVFGNNNTYNNSDIGGQYIDNNRMPFLNMMGDSQTQGTIDNINNSSSNNLLPYPAAASSLYTPLVPPAQIQQQQQHHHHHHQLSHPMPMMSLTMNPINAINNSVPNNPLSNQMMGPFFHPQMQPQLLNIEAASLVGHQALPHPPQVQQQVGVARPDEEKSREEIKFSFSDDELADTGGGANTSQREAKEDHDDADDLVPFDWL